jgi:hypothetical protein
MTYLRLIDMGSGLLQILPQVLPENPQARHLQPLKPLPDPNIYFSYGSFLLIHFCVSDTSVNKLLLYY